MAVSLHYLCQFYASELLVYKDTDVKPTPPENRNLANFNFPSPYLCSKCYLYMRNVNMDSLRLTEHA